MCRERGADCVASGVLCVSRVFLECVASVVELSYSRPRERSALEYCRVFELTAPRRCGRGVSAELPGSIVQRTSIVNHHGMSTGYHRVLSMRNCGRSIGMSIVGCCFSVIFDCQGV